MRGSIRGNGATGDCDEMELDANGASVPSSPGCFDSALSTPDVQKPRLDFETLETLDSVSLEPVGPSQGGEGFPYAPDEWPNPGDKWKWKVGRRRNAAGFWADRYLILPKTLQCGRRQVWFTSKSSVEKYLKKSFPDADHQTFFDSFQWQIPCTTPLSPTSAENNNEEGIAYAVKRLRESNSKCDGETPVKIHCKAGNAKCHLETGTGKFSNAVDCDICCVESGFCRECSCILCGKSIDQELGEYYFVQCEGNQGEDLICGHAAHLECAVICQTAGVVRSIGLDVEYYCRRCDKKTDLLKHVLGLIPTPELSKAADFKSNLNLALRLVQGTQQYGARILENLLQNALKKLQSGMKLQDIFGDLQNSSGTVNAGKVDNIKGNIPSLMEPSSNTPILLTKLGCKGGIHYQTERLPASPVSTSAATNEGVDYGIRSASRTVCSDLLQSKTLAPDMSSEKGNASAHDQFKKTRLLSEDTRRASDLQNLPDYIRRLKLENMVFQSLHMLRQSQETEFKLAQEKLFAQKDFVLSIFRQLEGTSCDFANNPSPTLENSAEKEHEKFVNMLAIANGFGSTPKGFLHHYFGIG